MSKAKEIDRLVQNLDPRAKAPRRFDLWSEKMIIMWLKQHQRKEKVSA
jgi:hypothetical protein